MSASASARQRFDFGGLFFAADVVRVHRLESDLLRGRLVLDQFGNRIRLRASARASAGDRSAPRAGRGASASGCAGRCGAFEQRPRIDVGNFESDGIGIRAAARALLPRRTSRAGAGRRGGRRGGPCSGLRRLWAAGGAGAAGAAGGAGRGCGRGRALRGGRCGGSGRTLRGGRGGTRRCGWRRGGRAALARRARGAGGGRRTSYSAAAGGGAAGGGVDGSGGSGRLAQEREPAHEIRGGRRDEFRRALAVEELGVGDDHRDAEQIVER